MWKFRRFGEREKAAGIYACRRQRNRAIGTLKRAICWVWRVRKPALSWRRRAQNGGRWSADKERSG